MTGQDVCTAGLECGNGEVVVSIFGVKDDGSESVRFGCSNLPADIDPILPGKIHMDEKGVDRLRACHFRCAVGGFRFEDLIALALQRFDRQSPGIRIVVDDQYAMGLQSISFTATFPPNCNRGDVKFRKGPGGWITGFGD